MNIKKSIPTSYGDWSSRFGEAWNSQVETLKKAFPDAIEEVRMPRSDVTDVPIVYVKKENLVEIIRYVKIEPGFEYNFLADITATDEQPQTPRFELIYNLFSHSRLWRIRFKVRLEEGEKVGTLIPLWKGADWAEREVFDMFGIRFEGHPDLRRILMDERWEGHPLRKDYPLKKYQIFATPEPIDPELLK
jgi:NADH-quinone oxidoreductase subunit C